MTDELLPYYNHELAFLRNLGKEFAEAHPGVAGRLRLDVDMAADPHVARIVEAFAYLNARTRHKIDDDFPEISEAMLNVLFPHYLAPIPSMSIVKFVLDQSQADLTGGYLIDRHSVLESEPVDGHRCRFRTAYPVTLWPFELTEARFQGPPFSMPESRFTSKAMAVVRLSLESFSPEVPFHNMELRGLRFFLHGQSQHVYDLYETLLNNTLAIVVASSTSEKTPSVLRADRIQPVGFGRNEGTLPYSPRSFLGYRLLTEYFSLPEKFLFFDINGLSADVLSPIGNRLELYILLDRYVRDLERNVSKDTFQLGCTPVVNLFAQRAEPIALSHTQYEYRVVPDARRPRAHEIHAVDRVVATAPDNTNVEFQPFYSVKHGRDAQAQRAYWHATRRPAGHSGGKVDRGTEVYLSLVDLDFHPSSLAHWTIDVQTTCCNRDLPHQLPFGGGQPRLQLSAGAPLEQLLCLTPPTPTFRPSLRHGTVWRLISHLTLNHLSLTDSEEGADALREILRLYDFSDSAETRAMIDGLLSVHSRRVVGRAHGAAAAVFCRGLEVTLHFDEDKFTGAGVYLLAAVLDRFLGLYSSINSFTKTVATTNKPDRVFDKWPPRAGEKVLL